MKMIQCDACGLTIMASPEALEKMGHLDYDARTGTPIDLCPNCIAEVAETIAEIQARS